MLVYVGRPGHPDAGPPRARALWPWPKPREFLPVAEACGAVCDIVNSSIIPSSYNIKYMYSGGPPSSDGGVYRTRITRPRPGVGASHRRERAPRPDVGTGSREASRQGIERAVTCPPGSRPYQFERALKSEEREPRDIHRHDMGQYSSTIF